MLEKRAFSNAKAGSHRPEKVVSRDILSLVLSECGCFGPTLLTINGTRERHATPFKGLIRANKRQSAGSRYLINMNLTFLRKQLLHQFISGNITSSAPVVGRYFWLLSFFPAVKLFHYLDYSVLFSRLIGFTLQFFYIWHMVYGTYGKCGIW